MKKLIFKLALFLLGFLQAQAQNPYAALGIEEQVLRYDDTHEEVFKNDTIKPIGYAIYNPTLGLVCIFDLTDSLVTIQIIDPSKVARFPSVDPRLDKYPGWSPYNYVLGNPVLNIDPRGDTVKVSHEGNDYVYNNGQLFLNGAEYTGKQSGFLKQTVKGLNKLVSTEAGGNMINSLVMSDKNIVIKFKSGAANFVPGFERFGKPDLRNNAEGLRVKETGQKVLDFFDFTEVGSGGIVYWDPNLRPEGSNSTIVLGHELFHGLDATRGMLDSRQINMGGGYEQIQEVRAVYTENLIRRELGMIMRTTYSNGGPSLIDAAGNPINISPPYKFE